MQESFLQTIRMFEDIIHLFNITLKNSSINFHLNYLSKFEECLVYLVDFVNHYNFTAPV